MLNDFQKEVLKDNGMKKAVITIIVVLVLVLLVIPLIFVTAAMLTKGSITIENNGKILFKYDSESKKFIINEEITYDLDGIDGPYIISDSLYVVHGNNSLERKLLITEEIIVNVDNDDKDSFKVRLADSLIKQKSIYKMPEKLIAVSDIEGNFNALSSFLLSNKVIDENYNWAYGKGSLLLNGDMVDRGNNVLPVLWLIYKLEYQAERAGGKVHFILGNHDVMNIQGRFRYARDKYRKLAVLIGTHEDERDNYKELFSEKSHLGKWLRSKNVIEKIGDYIFVHAGLSKELIDLGMNLDEINSFIRDNYDTDFSEENITAKTLYSRMGPLWYRGLATDYKYYKKIEAPILDEVLTFFKVNKVVIGHTVMDDISTDYDGKVIKIDLKHGTTKRSGKTKGLLIENGVEYIVDDIGNKRVLK